MTTLVTGATGATGHLLVQQLLDRGETVKVAVRPDSLHDESEVTPDAKPDAFVGWAPPTKPEKVGNAHPTTPFPCRRGRPGNSKRQTNNNKKVNPMRVQQSLAVPSFLALLLAGIVGCSDTMEAEGGHLIYPEQIEEILNTEMHDRAITEKAMDYIRLSEDYTADTFEQQQKEAIAQMTSTHRQRAYDYLPTRVQSVESESRSNSVSLDKYSAVLGKRKWGDQVRASLRIQSDNAMTRNGKKYRDRMEYVLHILIYNLDDFEYEMLGVNQAD